MRYVHPKIFLPLKILMMSHCQYLSPWWSIFITITIWFIRGWTVFSLSRPFVFLFRRLFPFIFLAIFIFRLVIVMTLLFKVLSRGRVSHGIFSTWVISGSSPIMTMQNKRNWIIGCHRIKISSSLTCVSLCALNC